ncbi:MAG: NADH-quinone oxidoreductase subunit J, partial [Pseudomonadota bacterium]
YIKNAPVGLLVGGIVLAELAVVFLGSQIAVGTSTSALTAMPTQGSGISNTEAIGRVLYTDYIYFFQAAGLILLVAMVGAIVLTLRQREGVKRQSIAAQNARTPATAMDVVKVAPGGAIIPSASTDEGR